MTKKIAFDIVGNDRDAVRAFDRVGGAAKKLQGSLGKLGGGARSVLKPIAAVSSAGAALTNIAGPAAIGVAKLASAGTHLALTLAPLAATLPAVAGGFVLLKQTAVSTGPAMAKALDPVKKAFVDNQKEVDKLATKGLPSLAKGFVKANFPTIAMGMERIARAQNQVVVGVGNWVNSSNGQKAIKTIVEGTAKAAERLAPKVIQVARSFGDLVGRAGGGALDRIATGMGKAADEAKRLMDNISTQDIQAAWKEFDHLADIVGGLPDKLKTLTGELRKGVDWWKANQGPINQVHLALTGVAVAAGILTGQWLPALAAGGTLIATNWSSIPGVASSISGWFSQVAGDGTTLGAVFDQIGSAVQSWGSTFMEWVGRAQPVLEPLMKNLKQLGDSAAESFRLAMPAIKLFGDQVAGVLGGLVGVLGVVAVGIAWFATFVAKTFNVLAQGVALAIKGILGVTAQLIDGIGGALAKIPGPFGELGRQMQRAAGDIRGKAADIQNYIDGIHGKTINIDVVTNYKTGTGTPSGPLKVGYRAAGGPVQAGQPYVVGESGRELFVPKGAGTIMSASKTKAMTAGPRPLMAGGGGGNTYVTVNVQGHALASARDIEDVVVRAIDGANQHGRLPVRMRSR